MSYYRFLEKNLDAFWRKSTGKSLDQSGSTGIISAHGDKGESYRGIWEEAGIHFYHGMMLFMLTYSNIMDRPKHESSKWVIDNYPKYRDMLPPIHIEYVAIYHNPTGKITSQFEDDGSAYAKMRLDSILEDLDELSLEDRSQYKVIRYSCDNDPSFRLPDQAQRQDTKNW